MKLKYLVCAFWTFGTLFAQKEKANNLVVEGNDFHEDKKYISAEAQYRKALALDEARTDAQHNLGNTLYRTEDYTAAAQRYFLTQKGTEDKREKQAAFHNIGNVHMQAKAYEKAVESYKQALRNNPADEESRYNYALAKELLEKQKQEQEQNQDQNQDQDQDQDQKKEQQDQDKDSSEGDQKEDTSDDQQKEGDEKKEEGDQGEKEKEQEKNSDQQKKGNEEKPDKKPPRKPGQISPEQVQSLLKAMNQQEREVQDKVNAEKVQGVPVKTKKDW